MSDNFIRHFVSIAVTLIVLIAWVAGYFSGINGWWWTVLGIVVVYALVYKLIKV